MLIGYARVSTTDQDTTPQEDQLRAAGCERIFRDVASGARTARPGLDAMLADARKGDVIVVWRLDRLGRSLPHLIETVGTLEREGKGFQSLTESIDTTTPSGKLVFHLFAALAEFERSLIRERVRAGVASARARGRTGGRPLALDPKAAKLAVRLMGDRDRNVADICRTLGVSRSTLYRIARQAHEQPPAVSTPAEFPGGPIREGKRTSKGSEKAGRGVPPQAAAMHDWKAVSSPRQPTKATDKAKTPTTPRKGTKTASSKTRKL